VPGPLPPRGLRGAGAGLLCPPSGALGHDPCRVIHRGLLDEQDLASLGRLEELSIALQAMAEKELQGQPLTEDEYTAYVATATR